MRKARVVAVLLVGALAAACGLDTNYSVPFQIQPGAIRAEPSLKGVTLTVGSKDFTESIVLGYMAEFALSAAGADVKDLTNIQGTNSARQALTTSDTDLYWDYTGTGWLSFLNHDKAIRDQRKQYQAVRDEDLRLNNLVWLPYSPVNDTYAFAVKKNFAERNNLKTVSDMVKLIKKDPSKGTFCLETEFISRPDGMPGAKKTYDFDVPDGNIVKLTSGTIYKATGGPCNFGEVFTTDGRIVANNLAVLEDDKGFFPQYNASVVLRKDLYDRYPAIARVLAPIAAKLDNKTMLQLDGQVDVTGVDAAVVARNWLVSEGLIKYNAGT
jgi:osmoprotectant transport system substrate-binding protein